MKYYAALKLTPDQLIRLKANLAVIEAGKLTMVHAVDVESPMPEMFFNVELIPKNDFGQSLLDASMKDGMLHHWGWDKVFNFTEHSQSGQSRSGR